MSTSRNGISIGRAPFDETAKERLSAFLPLPSGTARWHACAAGPKTIPADCSESFGRGPRLRSRPLSLLPLNTRRRCGRQPVYLAMGGGCWDSATRRQGSARLAVRLQQEAERNRVRSILYHALAEERKHPDTEQLEQQIADLRRVGTPTLRPVLEQLEGELSKAKAESGLGTLPWKDAISRLKGDANPSPNAEVFSRDELYQQRPGWIRELLPLPRIFP